MGIVAGSVVASPERTYGELAPRPRESPVMLNCWLPTFDTVKVRAGPVAPQLTSPLGSFVSVPKVSVVAETLTFPWVPVPLSWMGEGRAVQRASVVASVTVAG